jgi:hypothetical protein
MAGSHARDAADATPAEVRHDFARYRCAGQNPVADEITYPADIEAAPGSASARKTPGMQLATDLSDRHVSAKDYARR